jgi:hypothetical protein
MIEDNASEVETDPATALAFAETTGKILAEAKLIGTEIEENYVAKDGTVYCLVSYSEAAAQKLATDVFNRQKAEYAAFRNWDAQNRMEAAFAKMRDEEPYVVSE